MRRTDIDKRIEVLAAKQYGAFNRRQAFELGASEQLVYRRLKGGDWIRPAPGVYALAGSGGSWLRQCKIAELSIEGSAIAGFSAAVLHEMPSYKAGHIELVATANANCVHSFATVHRYAGAKTTKINGINATTYAQTLCDIAPRTSVWRLERAMDDGLVSKKITVGDLTDRLEFYEGSRREELPRFRPLVLDRIAEGYIPPETELEAVLLDVLARIPGSLRVVRQSSFPWRTGQPGRVDVLLPDHRLIIEADGRRWHTRMENFDNDRWRDNVAVAHGHRVMRFTWTHLHELVDDSLELIRLTVDPAAA